MNDRRVANFNGLSWALLPPGLPALGDRVDSLEEHLALALSELRALGDEASWMVREAEDALDLALDLLRDEIGSVLTPVG